jgi:RimJ/RimL family protein N-acetyltransferase
MKRKFMRDLENWTGCKIPENVRLKGRFVTLEPFSAASHGKALWDALGGADAINDRLHYFPNPAYHSVADFIAWLESVQENWRTLVAVDPATGGVLGMASYMRIDAANGSIEVGAVAHGTAMARTPAATELHYLMARHVFDDLGYRRYEWKCHNDNQPSKRAAERLGFTFEGVFRQHMISKGKNRDTAWYAMIDKDWPVIGRALEAWLSPENFDPAGNQRQTLEDIRAALIAGERTDR